MAKEGPCRIAIAIRDRDLARRVWDAIETEPTLAVAAVAGDAASMRRMARTQPIHLAMVDAQVARGFEDRAARSDERGRQPVLILAATTERLLQAIPALAVCDGLLLADRNLDLLVPILQLGKQGLCAVPNDVAPLLLGDRLRQRHIADLTPREREVMDRLAVGQTNRQISDAMGVPETLVKAILRSIMLKLSFRNRTQAAVFAARFLAGRHSDSPDR